MESSRAFIRDFLCERYLEKRDAIAKLPKAALVKYQQYIKDIAGASLQKKILELFDDEQCLLQVDSHWQSLFVKDASIAVSDLKLKRISLNCSIMLRANAQTPVL